MTDVFISYSRRNTDFARRLIDRLILKGKDAWVDWEGIPLTSPNWWAEIKAGIETADSFVFIMSPDSMASVVCNMELDYAMELGKRILPVIYVQPSSEDAFASIADFEPDEAMQERLEGKDPLEIARENWTQLSHINWVFFRESDDFDKAFDALVDAIETDLSYVKAHTRYLTRASEWQRESKREDLLLFGEEIERGEYWLQKAEAYEAERQASERQDIVNPLPQPVQRDYILISRDAERRRRRLARSAQISIAVLVLVLIAGLVVAASIVSQTQQQVANVEATSAQNVVAAETMVGNANATLTPIPPTLTQAAVIREEAEEFRDLFLRYTGILLAQSNEGLNEAQVMERIDALVEEYSHIPKAYQARANTHTQFNNFEAALADLTTAIQLDENTDFLNDRAILYEEFLDEPELALADYDRAIELAPEDYELYGNRAIFFEVIQEDYDAALADYGRAIELNPDDPGNFLNRGVLFVDLGEFEGAVADAERAIELDPNESRGFFLLGYAYYQLAEEGNEDIIVENWLQAYELDPDDVTNEMLNYLGENSDFEAVEPGITLRSELAPGDISAQLAPGFIDEWFYIGRAGERLNVAVETEWDAILDIYTDYDEEIGYADEFGSLATEEMSDVILPANGTYYIRVMGYNPGDGGPYTLNLDVQTDDEAITPQELAVGGNGGSIGSGDFDHWTYEAEAGDVFTLTVTADFDTTLMVLDANGDMLIHSIEDDELFDELDSQLAEIEVPEAGIYTIVVGSYNMEEFGDYTLILEMN